MINQGTVSSTEKSLLPALTELALDLRWAWNHSTDELWKRLDPELWELTHNPWVVLQTVSRQAVRHASADPVFSRKVEQMLLRKHELEGTPAWFQKVHPGTDLTRIAYFSMEFMVSEALPIYSGGLGNVAGDQLKAASDLGVPVVGVGLLYQQGYFRQEIDRNGFQRALYPFNDPGQLPIRPLRDANGEWLRIPLHLPEATLWVRSWQAQVGRTKLFLLDTNDPANLPTHRCIAGELYGGGSELRLQQELVLGLAGWRLLSALGLQPEVCHLNEGHAAFLVLERALSYMQEHDQPFDVALTITRAGNLFTTHTPVEAGFDRFTPELMRQYFGKYAQQVLRIEFDELMALGRQNRFDPSEPFNMAYLAIRGSGAVNGVSQLHGKVSRKILQPLFPRWPEVEVPVGHVTNGVHVPTWDSAEADALWSTKCGEERWRGALDSIERLNTVTDHELWALRTSACQSLVKYARKHLSRQRTYQGASAQEIAQAETIFDPHALTLGFARRFATYKRPNLLLHDPARLVRILTNRERPVQLILAGKAHPQDRGGQAMIKEWSDFITRPDVRSNVAFLSDYDVLLTSHLVQGVDLWLNTPRRPWEASGTSGMKVLVNGGLNLSELDGWWAEAYSPELGWAIGDGQEHGEDPSWDEREAEALYDLLEREVVPAFYARDQRGVPTAWVAKMRASMVQLTPRFSSNRAVREYVEKYYLPAAAAYRERAAHGGELGVDLSNWYKSIARSWSDLRFGTVTAQKQGDNYVFEVQVFLGQLDPPAVEVELYAQQTESRGFRQKMTQAPSPNAPAGYRVYSSRVPANRPASDYTPRLIPSNPRLSLPLEANQILWQR
ncbi:MAG TPA: alpha-glucan family phosphorylase [Terriglobales bacterium]|nr:alpha-glucan family phosphorylase [Terriglobales bacterium]